MYKEEFRTISGTYPNGRTKAIVVKENGTEYIAALDMTKPVTLQRMNELKAKIK